VSRCAPRTLAISQRRTGDGSDLPAWARDVAAAGAEALQLREKDLDPPRLLELARRLVDVVPATISVLVNGRVDVAIAARAAGAHLPSNGLPPALVRRRFPDLLLGVSTHHRDEVAAARDAGADYVVFGPVFAPTSKSGSMPPVGLGELARVARIGVPVLALGGVTIDRLGDLAAAGAAGVAAIGAFQPSADVRAFVDAAHRVFGVGVLR
jgi:thiamine-phosphate pyrophosphorylase